MEEHMMIEAAERFARGEMSQEETQLFEALRKDNPELDQLVVEQLFFLHEVEKFGQSINFRHRLQETERKLVAEGLITRKPFYGKAKIVNLWKRSKRTIAVAASIAGIVSMVSASLIATFNNKKGTNIKPLVEKINQQDKEIRKIKNKTDILAAASTTPLTPRVETKFRATGFLIDNKKDLIVTNAHVVREAQHQLIVENNKGEQFRAAAIYVDPTADLAIIQIQDKTFQSLSATPYTIRKTNADLGEQVYMLGYPKQEIVYGEGYISARNGYQLDTIFCQLSTSANEGNSGSPVINKQGDLLGIITSMETNATGVVYAIKASQIQKAIETIREQEAFKDAKFTGQQTLRGSDRLNQIKKVQDYVFMIKGN